MIKRSLEEEENNIKERLTDLIVQQHSLTSKKSKKKERLNFVFSLTI